MPDLIKLRLSSRVQFHLSGSQAWADKHHTEPHSDADEEAHRELCRKVAAVSSTRKDGSVAVELTEPEAYALEGYMGAMAAGGADNAWDPDGRGDLNAARACLRHLEAAGIQTRGWY